MSIPTSIHAARELFRVKTAGNEFVTLVHEATNEDPWGPTGPQMESVCRAFPRGSLDIMEEIRLRLKHREKSWRSCYKTLLLLDYLARNAAESALPEICSLIPTLRVIAQSFYYTGSKGVDHGLSVRERAKKLVDLLNDGVALREEREKAAQTRSKLSGTNAVSGGGGGYGSNRYSNYTGYPAGYNPSSSSHVPSGSYDPYVPQRPPVTRTREEQERYDMEFAARLQREEESRAGITAAEAERTFYQQARGRTSSVPQRVQDADMELARRLQEEEDRARQGGGGAPNVSAIPSVVPRPPEPPAPKAEPPKAEAPKAQSNVLDDLFAPSPPQAVAPPHAQPSWISTAPSAPAQSSADPFDAFLDARMQQHQQPTQVMPQGQQMFQGGVPPQMAPFPPQQQQQQQQQPRQQENFGWYTGVPVQQPQQQPQQQQQPSYGMAPMQPQQQLYGMTSQQNQWGMPAASENFFGQPNAMQQGAPPQGFMGGNPGGMNNANYMEQQFSGAFGGGQPNQKSLDALMAERHSSQ